MLETSKTKEQLAGELEEMRQKLAQLEAKIVDFAGLEKALKESELRFRTVADSTYDWEYWISPDASIVYISPSCEPITGYSPDEFTKNPRLLEEIVHKEDRQLIDSHFDLTSDHGPHSVDFRIVTKNGDIRWIAHECKAVFDHEGLWAGTRVSNRDITDRKLVEKESQQRQAMLMAVLDHIPSGVTIRDALAGTLILCNEPSRQMMGPLVETPDEFTSYRGVHPDGSEYKKEEWPICRSMATGEVVYSEEVECVRNDGSHVTFSINSAPARDSQGRIVAGIGVFHDITERKKAEKELKQRQETLLLFIEHSPVALAMFDKDMRYLAASHRWINDYGLGDSEVLGLSHYEVFPEIPDRWKEAHRRGLQGEVVRAEEEFFERIDGSIRWERREIRPWYTYDGAIGGIVIFTEDITDRKRDEENLKLTKVRLDLAQKAANAGTWEWDLRTNKSYWSDEMWRVLGLEPNGCEPCYETWVQSIHPDDRKTVELLAQAAVAKGTEFNAEWRVQDGKGGWRWIMARGKAVYDSSARMTRYIGISIDITDRKRDEEKLRQYSDDLEKLVEERILELRESRQMLRLIIDNLPVGIDYVDSSERYLFSNKTYQKWWNRPEEHITGLTVQEVMGEEYELARPILKSALGGQEITAELTIKYGDGVTRDISVNIIPHRGAHGEVKGLVRLITDITDIKKAQRELQASESKFRSLFENSMDGILFTAPDGRIFMANPTACRILGRTEEEICELGRDGIVDMTDPRLPVALEIRRRDSKVKCELNYLHKSGTVIPVEVTSTIFGYSPDEERAIVCLRDITKRKITEHALLQAKAELETKVLERTAELHETNEQLERELMERKRLDRSLLESSQFLRQTEKIARIGGWKVNPLTDSVKWTEGVYNIIEAPLDFKPRMEDGLGFYTQPYRSILKEALLKALEHNEPFKLEAEVVTTSGKRLWTEVRGLIRVEDEDVAQVVGTFQDITERKQAEDALRDSENRYRTLFQSLKDLINMHSGRVQNVSPSVGLRTLTDVSKDLEMNYIKNALRKTKGKVQPAAKLLGISRFSLMRQMAKLGINTHDYK
ncbi:MAG: PAS domain S-box protein [Deltaproteobacteria bacterium]|nr:PAS domain S-box protein [Deltaproteobacteria bacterium]